MKIFFSHSSVDKPLLREITQDLAPGLQAWIDERELVWGSNLEKSIQNAVENNDLFIIFFGQQALDSEWVKAELQWASKKELEEKKDFILPILLPEIKKEQIPVEINQRLFLSLPDREASSVKSLAEKINSRILQLLIKRHEPQRDMPSIPANVSIFTKSWITKYIECSEKIEKIKNAKTKKQLKKVLDSASKLTYTIVGAPQIYQHDHQILEGMNAGDVYRATHPFRANKSAHYMQSIQFRAYTQAQIKAASRGVTIKRLYFLASDSLSDLGDSENKHLFEINRESIESRIVYLDYIPPNELGEDFVIFDDNLLGVAIPKKGEMLGSEYRYSIDKDSAIIEEYQNYFDMIFDSAIPLSEVLDNSKDRTIKSILIHQNRKLNVTEPAFVLQSPVSINGKCSQRLMVVLRTAGCAYDKNNMGCIICDFKRHAAEPAEINADVLIQQLEYALDQATFGPNEVSQIDLLSLGSFLHDKEVPHKFRQLAFDKFARLKGVKKIVIESRSPYINEAKLIALKASLRDDQILEVGLGVETSDELIRNYVLRKNLPDSEIRRVIDVCANTGSSFMAYLLIGTMTLTGSDIVKDAVDSAKYIADLCAEKNVEFRIAFEPVFITHDTKLEEMYLQGDYELVNLWSVVDVIKAAAHLGTVFVGLSDEGLSSNRTPTGCPKCTGDLKLAIERFNGSQSLDEFQGLICDCQT